jgi:polar amino acid transport system substrate-binding protein
VRAPARVRGLVALAAVCVAASACARTDVPDALPGPTTTVVDPGGAAPNADTPGCDPATVTASLRPDAAAVAAAEGGAVAPDSYMAEIQARRRLRVGVDTATLQFSSVNPFTGEFEGFDVEIAREIALALFGTRDAIELVAIPYSQRVDVLAAQPEPLVDIVVNTFTINCDRDAQIDFSTEYFTSTQKLLVRTDSEARSIGDMTAEHRVCATANSTSIENLTALPEPRPEAVPVLDQADCLVLLQQGRVDAISTDDTILAGMVAQDRNLEIVGEGFSQEPYGVGLPPDRPEFVRYVNAVLDQVRSSGRWTELYDEWLFDLLDEDAEPPAALYED